MKKNATFRLLVFVISITIINACKPYKIVTINPNQDFIPVYGEDSDILLSASSNSDICFEFVRCFSENELFLFFNRFDRESRETITEVKSLKVTNNKAVIESLDESMQASVIEQIDHQYFIKTERHSAGRQVANFIGAVFASEMGRSYHENYDFDGWVKSHDQTQTIHFNGIIRRETAQTMYTVVGLVINFENKELGYEAAFQFDRANLPHNIFGLENIGRAMEVSPDGRFVKINNLLFDLSNRTQHRIYQSGSGIHGGKYYVRGLLSALTPDWSNLFIIYPEHENEKTSLGYNVKQNCETIIIRKTSFIPNI